MEHNSSEKSIHQNVSQAIQSGQVTMRSSFHFLGKSILLGCVLVVMFGLSSIILNYILFSIRIQGHHELFGFGLVGVLAFFHFFPWILFFLDCALAVLVIYLLQSFRFAYKTPLLYLGALLMGGVIIAGFLVERIGEPLNARFMHRMEQGALPAPLPVMMGHRESIRDPRHPLCVCEVIRVMDAQMLIARDVRSGRVYSFTLHTNSPYASTASLIPGDRVVILGQHDKGRDTDDILDVYGIRKIPHSPD